MPKQPKEIWEESPYSQELRGLLRPQGPVGGLAQLGLLGPQGGMMQASPEGIAGRQQSLMGAFDQITGGMNKLGGMQPTQYPTYREIPQQQAAKTTNQASLLESAGYQDEYNKMLQDLSMQEGYYWGTPSYEDWLRQMLERESK